MYVNEYITPGDIIVLILLAFLIICALFATFCRKLFTTVLIFMSFSLITSLIWLILEAPDLAGTEAAVGAGVTTVLFVLVLRKIAAIETKSKDNSPFRRPDEDFSDEELLEDVSVTDEETDI